MDELVAAMHENYLAALTNITVLGPKGQAARVGPWLLLDAGEDFDYFNVAAVAEPVSNPVLALETAIRWFGEREKPFRFVFRDDADAMLMDGARYLGFETSESEPAMLLPEIPYAWPPTTLRIERVTDDATADIYAAVEPEESGSLDVRKAISRRGVALPECSLFLGDEGELPVARAMGLRTGAMAGVYNVYVGDGHRRRGYGEAITAAVLDDARRSGATAACLSASGLGYRLYLRMGFEPLFRYVSMWRGGGGPPPPPPAEFSPGRAGSVRGRSGRRQRFPSRRPRARGVRRSLRRGRTATGESVEGIPRILRESGAEASGQLETQTRRPPPSGKAASFVISRRCLSGTAWAGRRRQSPGAPQPACAMNPGA